MPELAEVETVRRGLLSLIVGQKITAVVTDRNERFMEAELSVDDRVIDVRRRGKYLIVELESGRDMVVHLGMTGALLSGQEHDQLERFRVRWQFEDSTLTLIDPRGFGRVGIVTRGNYERFSGLANLGPEPLEKFDLKPFIAAFKKPGATVKARLLGQKHLAGVGNYVCDEALWRSKIHPERRSLTPAESKRLFASLVDVFNEGIERGGMSIRNYQRVDGSRGEMSEHLDAYGREGLPCHRCGTGLVKSVVAARGSTWCPRCQKKPSK